MEIRVILLVFALTPLALVTSQPPAGRAAAGYLPPPPPRGFQLTCSGAFALADQYHNQPQPY